MALWLSLYFPRVAIEAVSHRADLHRAFALSDRRGAQNVIVDCNATAQRRGVRPGLALSVARAIDPGLSVVARHHAAEQQAINQLALAMGQFTPSVHVADIGTLLLEIEGSLTLFGGRDALARNVAQTISEMGFTCIAASAPTAYGAHWLARADQPIHVAHLSDLSAVLDRLSLRRLGWNAQLLEELEKLGVTTLAQCRALPRTGVLPRFGQAWLDTLDKAYGHKADPRLFFKPPPTFSDRVRLPVPVIDGEALLFVARRLFAGLAGFLRLRDFATQGVHIELKHADKTGTAIDVGFVKGARELSHLMRVFNEHVQRIQLRDEVHEVVLSVTRFQPYCPEAGSLFGKTATSIDPIGFVEQLGARLGQENVYGLQCHSDYRPEYAWLKRTLLSLADQDPRIDSPGYVLNKPLWILPVPEKLAVRNNGIYRRDALKLLSGPERLESGWWDAPIARDYFIAVEASGERLWIFRCMNTGVWEWYLHGIFS